MIRFRVRGLWCRDAAAVRSRAAQRRDRGGEHDSKLPLMRLMSIAAFEALKPHRVDGLPGGSERKLQQSDIDTETQTPNFLLVVRSTRWPDSIADTFDYSKSLKADSLFTTCK